MNPSFVERRFLKIAAASMVAASLFMLLGDTIWALGGKLTEESLLLRWISYIAFIPATVGLSYRLQGRGLGLTGGIMCLFGIGGGLSILTLYRLSTILQPGPGGLPAVIEESFNRNPDVPATIFLPGILFPLGLLLSGIALFRTEPGQWRPALFLSLGGVLFWVGNALGVLPALLVCDVVLLGVFTWLARQLWPAKVHNGLVAA